MGEVGERRIWHSSVLLEKSILQLNFAGLLQSNFLMRDLRNLVPFQLVCECLESLLCHMRSRQTGQTGSLSAHR